MSAKDLYPYLWLTPFIHYPNINNVSDAVDEPTRASILRSLHTPPARQRKAILYLHIPFCTSHCTFCFYNIRLAQENNPIFDQYVDALVAEIDLYAAQSYVQGLDFQYVFIGGGTPSVLPPALMTRLFGAIKPNFFPNKKIEEFTVEYALQTMSEERVATCREHGVTRISFGWQSFSPAARKLMSLRPTEEMLQQCMKLLRSYDYCVNTDLIYGLPGQTLEHWNNDLKRSLEFGFDGIDTFPIQPVPPSPLYNLVKERKLSIASNDDLLAMLRATIETFTGAGFVRTNFQRFCNPNQPSSQHRYNNAMFSTDYDVLALGSGAIGALQNRAYMNVRDIDNYTNWRGTLASPLSCAATMDDTQWDERAFCLQLPWLSKVRKDTLRSGVPSSQRETIEQLVAHGLLEETPEEFRLLPAAEGYNFNIARSFVSRQNQIRNQDYAESLATEINWKQKAPSRGTKLPVMPE